MDGLNLLTRRFVESRVFPSQQAASQSVHSPPHGLSLPVVVAHCLPQQSLTIRPLSHTHTHPLSNTPDSSKLTPVDCSHLRPSAPFCSLTSLLLPSRASSSFSTRCTVFPHYQHPHFSSAYAPEIPSTRAREKISKVILLSSLLRSASPLLSLSLDLSCPLAPPIQRPFVLLFALPFVPH